MKRRRDDSSAAGSLLRHFPARLITAVLVVGEELGCELFVSGGTVRDWLLAKTPADLDITVAEGAERCCKKLQDVLEGGTFVALGTEEEEAARIVWRSICIDFSSFRRGARTIEEELGFRDFTVNAMAVRLTAGSAEDDLVIIDPLGGRADLRAGLLRCCPDAFRHDPLRLLRGFRLQAELGLVMDGQCRRAVSRQACRIGSCAAERIRAELDRIMGSGAAHQAIGLMAEDTLLWELFPELAEGVGVEQPGYHHEDVFNHSLLALQEVEEVMARPRAFFGRHVRAVEEYLASGARRRRLCWAALFHDLGKPATRAEPEGAGGRTTFYNHDRVGAERFAEIAARLRMSRAERECIGRLVEMHMHPFHLGNVRRQEPLSRRALVKIWKKAGDDLPGLFLLAMADSLAGRGELKPAGLEEELSRLFDEVQEAGREHIEPVLRGRRLVGGDDLIELFGLEPGPSFRVILEELELARVEGKVGDREEALAWLEEYLQKRRQGEDGAASGGP